MDMKSSSVSPPVNMPPPTRYKKEGKYFFSRSISIPSNPLQTSMLLSSSKTKSMNDFAAQKGAVLSGYSILSLSIIDTIKLRNF